MGVIDGRGVLVGRSVAVGSGVAVFVGEGTSVLVGVLVGTRVGVLVGMRVEVGSGRGRRVWVGSMTVGKRKTTGVLDAVTVIFVGVVVSVALAGGVGVDVAASSEKASRVCAATVFKFSTKDSTTSPGCRAMAVATFKS